MPSLDALDRPSSRRNRITTASIRTPRTKSTCSTTGAPSASVCGWFWESSRWSRCWRSFTLRVNPIFTKLRRESKSISKTPAPCEQLLAPIYGPADDPIYFNTQLQILVSPGLMRRVVRTLDLEHNPDFFKGNPAQRQSTWQTMLRMVDSEVSRRTQAPKTPDQLPLTNSRPGNSARRSERS